MKVRSEADWLASTDLAAMLERLLSWDKNGRHPWATDRKLRLVACACLRPCEYEVELAAIEGWVDGKRKRPVPKTQGAIWAASHNIEPSVQSIMRCCEQAGSKSLAAMADILRDIIQPFPPDAPLSPTILTPTVLDLAEAAYENRPGRKCEKCGGSGRWREPRPHRLYRWHTEMVDAGPCKACRGTGGVEDGSLDQVRLSILADALEEVGADGGIVAHLRSPGPHHRGCWVIDRILGRK